MAEFAGRYSARMATPCRCIRGTLPAKPIPGDGVRSGWSESQDLKKTEFVFEMSAGHYILVYQRPGANRAHNTVSKNVLSRCERS